MREAVVNRTRSLSLNGGNAPGEQATTGEGSTETDSSNNNANFLNKLKAEAAKRVSELEKAEQKADEYLLKWGATVGAFLKEAVTIAPPQGGEFAQEGERGADSTEATSSTAAGKPAKIIQYAHLPYICGGYKILI